MIVRVVYTIVAVPLVAWALTRMATAAGTRHAFRFGHHRYYFEVLEAREHAARVTMLTLLAIIALTMAFVLGLSVVV